MKVYLRDLKNGPFSITDSVTVNDTAEVDKRIKDISEIYAKCSGNKFSDSIVLDVTLESKVKLDCDRCSDEIDYVIKDKFNALLTKRESLSDFNHTDFDVVIELNDDDIEIDLSEHLIEGVNVSLPMKLAPTEKKNGECSVCLKKFDYGSNQPEHHRKEFDKLKDLFK